MKQQSGGFARANCSSACLTSHSSRCKLSSTTTVLKDFFFSSAAIVLVSSRLWATPVDLSSGRITVLNPRQNTAAKAALMLRAEIEKRTRITLPVLPNLPSNQVPVILIGTAQDLAAESYRPPADAQVPDRPDAYSIWSDDSRRKAPTICSAGHDGRG